MDLLSPRPLQDLCIYVLANNPEILWKWEGENDQLPCSKPSGVEWRDPDLFIHNQLADSLLKYLSYNEIIGYGFLSTLTQERTCLKNVKIRYSDYIVEHGLQVLGHHKLISLDIKCLSPVDICTVLECIGNKSNDSLEHLTFGRKWICQVWPGDGDLSGQFVIETLSRFNCLKRVDLIRTDLTDTICTILCKSLPHVEDLNLSWNEQITDISPLKHCQKTLKSLTLVGLPDITADSAMATFMTLTGLTYLDVSMWIGHYNDTYHEFDRFPHRHGNNLFTADILFQMPDVIPNLRCLDLSGRKVRSEQALSQFLEAHPSLQMLVLWGSAACQFKSLQDFRPRLAVGGDATLEQYTAVLRHWTRNEEVKRKNEHMRKDAVRKLNIDLETKHFLPCQDDQLIQAILRTFHSQIFRQNLHVCLYFHMRLCLPVISLLLERKLITDRQLEPGTKQHHDLLWICRRAEEQFYESDFNMVVNILQALGQSTDYE